jgi:hypothetical protein
MTELEALEAIATAVKTITSPVLNTDHVYVYPPAEFGAQPVIITSYPTVIVSKNILGATEEWRLKAQGLGLHKWTADIQIFLAEKATPDYRVEQLTRGWAKALADVLVASRSLGGACYYMGDAATNDTGLMTIRNGYLVWYDQNSQNPSPYWGIMASVPITQIHNQTMG